MAVAGVPPGRTGRCEADETVCLVECRCDFCTAAVSSGGSLMRNLHLVNVGWSLMGNTV